MNDIRVIIAKAIREDRAKNSGCCAPWDMLPEAQRAHWIEDAEKVMSSLLEEAERKNSSVGEFARALEARYSLAVLGCSQPKRRNK